MQDILKLFEQPEYVHVLINHLPVTGLMVATITLLSAYIIKSRKAIFLALGLVAFFSLAAWPVAHFGHEGEDRAESLLYSEGKAWLEYHEDLAEDWIFIFYLTAAAAAGAGIVGWRVPKSLKFTVPVTTLLAFSSLAAGALIADAGGKIRHPEFRIGPPPMEDHDEHEAEEH